VMPMVGMSMVVIILTCSHVAGLATQLEAETPVGHHKKGMDTEYSVDVASKLFSFAAISYCSTKDVEQWHCMHCDSSFPPPVVFTAPSGEKVYLLSNDQDIVLVFQGTNGGDFQSFTQDLSPNMLSADRVCLSCFFNTAFLTSHQQQSTVLTAAIKEAMHKHPKAHIFIVGHSAGAAYAVLMAYDLVMGNVISSPDSDLTVYTFGAPRVGNKVWATAYNLAVTHSYRVTNAADGIAHLPPRGVSPYFHEGQLVYCATTGDKSTCSLFPNLEDDSQWGHISLSDHKNYLGLNLKDFIDDHSPGCQSVVQEQPRHAHTEASHPNSHASNTLFLEKRLAKKRQLKK